MTSVCQGLSSLALWGGKMKDPGNEVVFVGLEVDTRKMDVSIFYFFDG